MTIYRKRDIEEFLGSELVALRKKGMRPILHLDFRTVPTKFLWISLGCRDVRRLARDKCGFEVSASSETGDVKQIVSLSPHLVGMMSWRLQCQLPRSCFCSGRFCLRTDN